MPPLSTAAPPGRKIPDFRPPISNFCPIPALASHTGVEMNDSQTSDAELLAAWVRQRDEAAFCAVVNRKARWIEA